MRDRISSNLNRAVLLCSVSLIGLICFIGWFMRHHLNKLFFQEGEVLASINLGLVVYWFVLVTFLVLEDACERRDWSRRIERLAGLEQVTRSSHIRQWLTTLPDPLEWFLAPFLQTSIGQALACMWKDAGFGGKGSRFALLLIMSGGLGWLLGLRIGGVILAATLAILAPIIPIQIVKNRAGAKPHLFVDQLPQLLDSLSSGLSAGLSLDQAVTFAAQELPEPSAEAMLRLSHRLALGIPLDDSLAMLEQAHPEESLSLLIDSISLQRRYGGDLVRVLEGTAQLIRERVELEREVRSVTVQGRMSGIVLALLVPVSAGFLLVFNPTYIEILFESLIGQSILVTALLLQLTGWAIISRMVRIRY